MRVPEGEVRVTHMSVDPFLSGELLYGDDFTRAEIEAWFADEKEGYASLGAEEHSSADTYGYHGLNIRHGFRHLPDGRLGDALGLGSAYGREFLPVIDRLDRLTILEPSFALRSDNVGGVPVQYVDPDPSGSMPFEDATFDLVLSLGTLHHIPNVTHVISEIGRVTAPGGWALAREPVTSMGDWRVPRRGLTSRERGIPLHIFHRAFAASRLTVIRETPCMFPTTGRLAPYGLGFQHTPGVLLDHALSVATAWNDRYHSTRWWHKIHPVARFFILRKD